MDICDVRHFSMKKVFAIGVIVALAFGIYYVAAFQHLNYDIDALRLDDVGVLSASVTVFLRVNNPNPLPLYLASTTFGLYINEDYAGHGSTEAATIGGYGYQRIHAPVTISYTGLSATVVNSILSGGRITLDIRGDAHFFVITVPFEISDTLTLT
jgi:LEA14-like dessication related protein